MTQIKTERKIQMKELKENKFYLLYSNEALIAEMVEEQSEVDFILGEFESMADSFKLLSYDLRIQRDIDFDHLHLCFEAVKKLPVSYQNLKRTQEHLNDNPKGLEKEMLEFEEEMYSDEIKKFKNILEDDFYQPSMMWCEEVELYA